MVIPPAPHDAPTLPAPPDAVEALCAPRRPGSPWRQIARSFGWHEAAPAGPDLQTARNAFIACLTDLPPIDCRALCHLLAHAKSLAELWHLRPEVYRTLALHHSQAEAENRVAALAGLFGVPTRPPRGATPLQGQLQRPPR